MTQQKAAQDAALVTMAKWVSTIADNIRNPISGISAALSILEQELGTQAETYQAESTLVDDALERIRRRLTSLGDYVSELIDFARPAEVFPQAIDLSIIVGSIRDCMSHTLTTVKVEVDIPTEAAAVRADHDKLRVVLAGLIRNAAEAALTVPSHQQPRVAIYGQRGSAGVPNGTIIAIGDNGPGFSDLASIHAFEPFFSTKEHGGTMTIGTCPRLGGALVTLFLPDDAGAALRNSPTYSS